MTKSPVPYGWLVLCGWFGTTKTRVVVLKTTAKRALVRAISDTRLAGRGRILSAGKEAWIPAHAIILEHEEEVQ